jgi:hypothetical protein
LEQYKEHVDAHALIISWMSKNIVIDLPLTPLPILQLFQSQSTIFENHKTKFYSYFGLEESVKNVEIDHYVKIANETIEDSPSIEIKKEENKLPKTKSQKEFSEKPKKEPLMTDEKARNFLLETVFNIDAKYLD